MYPNTSLIQYYFLFDICTLFIGDAFCIVFSIMGLWTTTAMRDLILTCVKKTGRDMTTRTKRNMDVNDEDKAEPGA